MCYPVVLFGISPHQANSMTVLDSGVEAFSAFRPFSISHNRQFPNLRSNHGGWLSLMFGGWSHCCTKTYVAKKYCPVFSFYLHSVIDTVSGTSVFRYRGALCFLPLMRFGCVICAAQASGVLNILLSRFLFFAFRSDRNAVELSPRVNSAACHGDNKRLPRTTKFKATSLYSFQEIIIFTFVVKYQNPLRWASGYQFLWLSTTFQ